MIAISFDATLFYNVVKYVFFGIGIAVFILLFFVSAPYGRHVREGWGKTIDNKWGWILMEAVSPIVFFIWFILGDRKTPIPIFFLGLWELHYVQRAFIYPLLIRGKKRMPIVIMAFGMIFNTLNTYIQGWYLFHHAEPYADTWFCDPRLIIGTIGFLIGYYINLRSDYITRHLRKPGETGYKIPRGGLFEKVSCPNYFGELVEWFSWALLTWSMAGVFFAVWTLCNLMPRAMANHKWYLEKFEDYPKERKALFPYVW